MINDSALTRVLKALRDGPRLRRDVCAEAECSQAQLNEVSEIGFIRFPASARGDEACITPKGTERFNAKKG